MLTHPFLVEAYAMVAVTLLLVLLATGARRPAFRGGVRLPMPNPAASQPRVGNAPSAAAHADRAPKRRAPALKRAEIEKVLSDAEVAAVTSALGDLEADRNPYPLNSRPGLLWEAKFNSVFLDWSGQPRPRRRTMG